MTRWLIYFFLLLTRVWPAQDRLETVLQKIPPKDQKALERLFHHLLFEQGGAYTLFGPKSASVALIFLEEGRAFENTFLLEGWRVFQKHRSLLKTPRFSLCLMEYPKLAAFDLVIINHQALKKGIEEAQEIFDPYFPGKDADQTLQAICHQKVSFFAFKRPKAEALIGTFLGYGKENAKRFQKEQQILSEMAYTLLPPKKEHPRQKELPFQAQWGLNYCVPAKQSSASLDELFNAIDPLMRQRGNYEPKNTHYSLEKTVSLGFVDWGDSTLTKAYQQTQKKLTQAYKQGSFLEVTLKQWFDPQ